MKGKITEHSIELFESRGFSDTSIQDIVDSLGVTKGTFYYYFSSKEELLMNIHLGYIDGLLDRQDEILRDSTVNNKEKLFEIVHLLIGSIKSKGTSAKIFFREMRHLSEDRLAQIVDKRDRFRLNVERVVRNGIDTGEFRPDLNAAIVTFGILGAANWSYQWFNPNGASTDREVAEILVEMVLRGIEK
ncbi:TetR/AcrR family transcriptional regulator [Peribacillus sp. SCS-37]|uniref:TetR/AcrR family transcriptional regulator n=1 Tax=Paraperibacillus esterisolvens TaxID=3115296 RepID=UPI0039057AA7